MTPRYRLVFFDVDSTLVTIEGIDVLAGGHSEIAALTEAAMAGSIPIEDVYAQRLEIVKPTRRQVEELGKVYIESLIPEALGVISELRQSGVDVHLVTAGIEQAILPLGAKLGLQQRAIHAVPLIFRANGAYLDFDRGSPLTRARGKETVVQDVRARSHGKAMYVGDGVTDLDVKDAVDLFVGFGGVRIRERVRQEADVFTTDLREILRLTMDTASVRRFEIKMKNEK